MALSPSRPQQCGSPFAVRQNKARHAFVLVALAQISYLSLDQAKAIDIPPGSGTIPPEEPSDAPIAPPTVYLTRTTYYSGEAIAGQIDCPACYANGPIFRDENGLAIAGTLTYSDVHHGSFIFVPDMPLLPGIYSVAIETYLTTSFEVIEGEPMVPTFHASFHEVKAGVGNPVECQSYAPSYTTASYPQTRVDAQFVIAVLGESADQYQFEYSIDDDARVVFDTAPLAIFRHGHGEVCVEVFARSYVDDSEMSLGVSCLDPDVELDLGLRDEPFGVVENVLRACVVPPDGYFEAWCELHTEAFLRHTCTGFIESACLEARYECPGGDLPEWFDENGIDPENPEGEPIDDSADADDGSSADAGGCSCTTGAGAGGHENTAALFGGLGATLLALRRRRRILEAP